LKSDSARTITFCVSATAALRCACDGCLDVVLYRHTRAAILAASGGYREFARVRRARRNQVRDHADWQHHLVMTDPDNPEGTYGALPPYV
jgi:hypothetical protein